MPIFEYRCTRCDHLFEELVQGDRDKKVPCPKCGEGNTIRVMSVIGGISMGKSAGPSCASGCPGASSSGCSAGGCCPHGV